VIRKHSLDMDMDSYGKAFEFKGTPFALQDPPKDLGEMVAH
jgi:hypothetical protein